VLSSLGARRGHATLSTVREVDAASGGDPESRCLTTGSFTNGSATP
jgi:hypothetical protein